MGSPTTLTQTLPTAELDKPVEIIESTEQTTGLTDALWEAALEELAKDITEANT